MRSFLIRRFLACAVCCAMLLAGDSHLQARQGATWLDNGALIGVKYTGSDGGGLGWGDDGYTTFSLFRPFGDATRVVYGDLRFSLTNNSRTVGNVGLGFREYLEWSDRVFGAAISYDVDDGHRRTFNQLTLTLECLGDDWDLLGNVYLPVGARNKLAEESLTVLSNSPDNVRYRGHNIVFDLLQTSLRRQVYEAAMGGGDMELGGPLPGWLGQYGVSGYAGWYHFQAEGSPQIWGPRGRLQARVTDRIDAQLLVTDDRIFGTTVMFNCSFALGGRPRRQTCNLVAKMFTPPVRNERIVVAQQLRQTVEVNTLATNVVLNNPDSGQPITLTHIDSNAPGGGNGTFETPLANLTTAAGSTTDIVLAHAGSTFTDESYTLAAGQRFLGDGATVPHTVATQQLGVITMPRANALAAQPVITFAGEGISIVNLAAGSEVSGFVMSTAGDSNVPVFADFAGAAASVNRNIISTSGPSSDGIFARGDSRVNVTNNTISTDGNGSDGVFTRDNSRVSVTGNTITTTGGGNGVFARTFNAGDTLFLSAFGNVLNAGTGIIRLEENAGTLNVTQTSAADLANQNGIPVGNIDIPVGAPTFGVPLGP